MDLFECKKLHAKISERQCKLNSNGYRSKGVKYPPHISCQGCAGLGKSAQVPLPVQEEVLKKKKIECGRSGCGYGVKKEGDFCKKHQEPVVIPVKEQQRGLDDGPPLPRKYASDLSSVIIDAPGRITFEDDQEKAAQACGPVQDSATEPKSGLSALLRTPPQSDGLLIPFTHEETVQLIEAGIGAQDIRDLAKMLLAGELQRVVGA